jgi:pimeloyl-ACP methyl ester carboxylesterase
MKKVVLIATLPLMFLELLHALGSNTLNAQSRASHPEYCSGSLIEDAFYVSIVQEPETSFQRDVAATKRILAMQDGPCILVAHSYGGAVIWSFYISGLECLDFCAFI